MPLDLTTYITKKNYWKGIRDYITEYSNHYSDLDQYVHTNMQDASDDDIRRFINARFRTLVPKDSIENAEWDSFRHCTQDLMKGTRNNILRLNQYRLIFALRFESADEAVREANNFLLNYLLEPDLSARNLLDFIMIAALQLDLDWLQALQYYNTYQDFLQPPATEDPLEKGTTKRLRNEPLKFNTGDDIAKFLGKPDAEPPSENLMQFAVTNNTRYQTLFNRFDIQKEDETITIYGDKKLTNEYLHSMIICLRNWDDSPKNNAENPLTEKDIKRLSKVFPDVFMTLDNFNSLKKRNRNVEITHGIMLLKLLEELNPYLDDADNEEEPVKFDILQDPVDFTDINEIKSVATMFFEGVGLPKLSVNDSFDRLVIDTHNELSKEYPDDDSVSFKSKFFRRLRYYCKEIANM